MSAITSVLLLALPSLPPQDPPKLTAEQNPFGVEVPARVDRASVKARRAKKTNLLENAVIVADPMPVYRDPRCSKAVEFPERDARRPEWGAYYNVLAVHPFPRAYLLAWFDLDAVGRPSRLDHVVGWVRPEDVLRHGKALDARRAQERLEELVPNENDRMRRFVRRMLPEKARDPRFENVTLKALTSPGQKLWVYRKRMWRDEEGNLQPAGTSSVLLDQFWTYYVADFQVQENRIHCLLARSTVIPDVNILGLNRRERHRAKDQLWGWVDAEQLTLWGTREAIDFNRDREARAARQRADDPITVWPFDLRDAQEEPFDREDFEDPYWQNPLQKHAMRHPLLDRYELDDGGLGFKLVQPYGFNRSPDIVVGLELRDDGCAVYGVAKDGRAVPLGEPPAATPAAIEAFFETNERLRSVNLVRTVLEQGPQSQWVAQSLNDFGYDVAVVDSERARARLRRTASTPLDPRSLATLGRFSSTELAQVSHWQSPGRGRIPIRDFLIARGNLQLALERMRKIELVIVLDRTTSMQVIDEPLIGALRDLIEQIKREESRRESAVTGGVGDQLELRVGLVQFRDHGDEFLVKPGDRFHDVRAEVGLQDFLDELRSAKVDGGRDELEQPFEGIRCAITHFLADDSGRHEPQAGRIVLVVGDQGNHLVGSDLAEISPEIRAEQVWIEQKEWIELGSEKTKISMAKVLEMLKPVGGVAETTLHAVRVLHEANVSLGKPWDFWDKQFPELATKTGGRASEVRLVHTSDTASEVEKEAEQERVKNALVSVLRTSLDKRREDLKKQIRAWQENPQGAIGKLHEKMLLEGGTVTREQLELIKDGESLIVPALVHTRRKSPSDVHERTRLCILLTVDEFEQVRRAIVDLESGITKILKRSQDPLVDRADIRELIRRGMVALMWRVFGREGKPEERHYALGMGLIQQQLSALPMRLSFLERETYPGNLDELGRFLDELRSAQRRLNDVLTENRFFEVGNSPKHIWLYESELP